MKTWLLLICLCLPALQAQAVSVMKSVYGSDDRLEADEHPDRLLRDYSDSVAAMVRSYRLLDAAPVEHQSFDNYRDELYALLGEEFIEENPGLVREAYDSYLVQGVSRSTRRSSSHIEDPLTYYFNLNRTLERSLRVCPSERFADQPVLSDCTGFLVAPDLLITAAHCMQTDYECDHFRWVFGYKKGVYQFPQEDVYRCEKVVTSELSDSIFSTKDYSLIKLDRSVEERAPLPVRTNGYIDKGDPLAVIGHPSGLPMKIADNAQVMTRRINFFYSNLDSFSGNSGSPVINTRTGLVEGILIQGAGDYVPTGEGCQVSRLQRSDNNDQEKVFRMPRVDDLEEFLSGERSY